MEEIIQVKCAAETEKVGYELAKRLELGGINKAFIALFGEMGVGKTAFVRGFCSFFGQARVKSPTFSIVNEYRFDGSSVFHFDMYRITDDEDLYSTGFYEYFSRDGYMLCEWCENIPYALPSRRIEVNIVKDDLNTPDSRTVSVTLVED